MDNGTTNERDRGSSSDGGNGRGSGSLEGTEGAVGPGGQTDNSSSSLLNGDNGEGHATHKGGVLSDDDTATRSGSGSTTTTGSGGGPLPRPSSQQSVPTETCATPTRRNVALEDGAGRGGVQALAVPLMSSDQEEAGTAAATAASSPSLVLATATSASSDDGNVSSSSSSAIDETSNGTANGPLLEPSFRAVYSGTAESPAKTSNASEQPVRSPLFRRADTAPPAFVGAEGSTGSPRTVRSDGDGGGLPPRPPISVGMGTGRIPPPPLQSQHPQQHQHGEEHASSMGPSIPSQALSYQQSPAPRSISVGKPPSPPGGVDAGGDAATSNVSSSAAATRGPPASLIPGAVPQEPTDEEVSSSMEAIISSPQVQQSNENIVERSPGGRYLRFQEKLGSGAYKDVYRAYDTIEGIEVAWNVVNLAGVPKSERVRIVHEVRLLERLHHKNIISFHGSWVNREKEQVIFVTEILSSGTLKSFINKVQVIRWKIAKRWAIQILKGLEYLHSQDPPIIHRDLKCDNIFINGTSGDLRIGDLGLSTVIDNKNKVLSVLGTPEFMAPELYDESYDEKVDIYAFGMCLLEIFTKEVPYRECTNPAQIYKRVMNGIPPNSLSRVRNIEAKEFIMHCLGTGEDKEAPARPSASELLRHPFLANKKVDDNSEVEVDPSFDDMSTVHETNSLGEVSVLTASTKGPSEVDLAGSTVPSNLPPNQTKASSIQREDSQEGSFQAVQPHPHQYPVPATSQAPKDQFTKNVTNGEHALSGETPPQRRATVPDDDHFSGMPESETNMKKVKVLMGRGEEIEDDDEDGQVHSGIPLPSAPNQPLAISDSGKKDAEGEQSVTPSDSRYCAFAAVIEEEKVGANPYEGDIMKLVITLPIDGKTQNVQFDFHLVEDDPVQVAREMVTELHIPQDAILEISETISGLARSARIKQGKRVGVGQQIPQPEVGILPRQRQHHYQQQALQPPAVPSIETPTNAMKRIDSENSPRIPQHEQDMPTQAEQADTPSFPSLVAGLPSTGRSTRSDHGSVASEPSSSAEQALDPSWAEQAPQQPENSGDSDAESDDEIRQLEAAFQKNIHRAKKAFDTRMDNLQRSKVEKEALHKKTLEKHEKEKAEFEKRLKLAEEEQNRRLESLEKELERKKEELVKARIVGTAESGEEEDSSDDAGPSSGEPTASKAQPQESGNVFSIPLGPTTSFDRSRSVSIASQSPSEDSGNERA